MNTREEFIKAYQEFANDDERRAVLAFEKAQPTVYLSSTSEGVLLSAFPQDHVDTNEMESYTFELVELFQLRRTPKNRTHHISVGVLRNVLSRAGVKVVIE